MQIEVMKIKFGAFGSLRLIGVKMNELSDGPIRKWVDKSWNRVNYNHLDTKFIPFLLRNLEHLRTELIILTKDVIPLLLFLR